MANGLIILFGLSMLFIATTSRFIGHIRMLIAQGILLFLICLCNFDHHHILSFAFLTVETLIVKAIVIPTFLFKVVKKKHNKRYGSKHSTFLLFGYSKFDSFNLFFGFSLFNFIKQNCCSNLFWSFSGNNNYQPLVNHN